MANLFPTISVIAFDPGVKNLGKGLPACIEAGHKPGVEIRLSNQYDSFQMI